MLPEVCMTPAPMEPEARRALPAVDRALQMVTLRMNGNTYTNIGDLYGISPQRARQIVVKEFSKMMTAHLLATRFRESDGQQ